MSFLDWRELLECGRLTPQHTEGGEDLRVTPHFKVKARCSIWNGPASGAREGRISEGVVR